MHRSLSGSPGDCSHHTERTRSDGRISLTCCRNISTVWNSSESKWLRLQNFPENCHERLFQPNMWRILQLHYTLFCGRGLINILSEQHLLYYNQKILRWHANRLPTVCSLMHIALKSRLKSPVLILIWLSSAAHVLWSSEIRIFRVFTMKLKSVSKTVSDFFFLNFVCEIIFYTLFNTDKQCSVLVLIKFFMPHYYVFDKILKVTLDHKT